MGTDQAQFALFSFCYRAFVCLVQTQGGKIESLHSSFHVSKTTGAVVFLQYAKYSLYLNEPVHTKKRSFFAPQRFEYFGTVFVGYLIGSYHSVPVFGTMTFLAMRSSSAFVITVIFTALWEERFRLSCSAFQDAFPQPFSIQTCTCLHRLISLSVYQVQRFNYTKKQADAQYLSVNSIRFFCFRSILMRQPHFCGMQPN